MEFDAAVRGVVDRLAAEPAFRVPEPLGHSEEIQGLAGDAWPEIEAAMRLWRPVSVDHIAPVVLFAEPVLARVITPERGRRLLSTPRGEAR